MPLVPRLLPEIEFDEMLVKLLCGVSLHLETALINRRHFSVVHLASN